MKKILTLEKATMLKKNIDEKGGFISIDDDNTLIRENNAIIIDSITNTPIQNTGIDIKEIEDKKEIKSDLLVNLHIAILTANLKKSKNEKFCNAYYIKKLSEFNKEKKHLLLIKKSITEKNEKFRKRKLHFFINLKDILERMEGIEKNVQEIKKKIENFNKETVISIEITPIMDEFIKSIEN